MDRTTVRDKKTKPTPERPQLSKEDAVTPGTAESDLEAVEQDLEQRGPTES